MASDEEEDFPNYSSSSLQASLDTLCESSQIESQCSSSSDHRLSTAQTTSSIDHDDEDCLDSSGWWMATDYFNDPNAVYVGHEPEFTFRVIDEELSSAPDGPDSSDSQCIGDSDDEGFF